MSRRKFFRLASFLALLCAATLVLTQVSAQQEAPAPGRGQSVADTLESIQKARVVTRVLFTVAHPDDEASTLLTYLPHALGTDTTLLTLNRGEGGQNAIGPEQGAQLGILRSSELSAAMNVEGAHLYFTRVVDFGFSKTLEETRDKWHGVELEDMVRVIRMLRPQIVVNGWGGQKTGHGNHQDSGYQTPIAVEAAADPTKYPDQIAEGLKPWRAQVILNPVRGTTPDPNEKVDYTGSWVVPADDISPIWGLSYRDIALEGYLHHRSQGVTPFLNAPFLRRPYGLKRTTGGPPSPSDFAQPLTSLASVIPFPAEKTLAAADHALDEARVAAEKLDWAGAVHSIAAAGKLIASIEDDIRRVSKGMGWDETLWELAQVRDRINHALADAAAIKIVSNSDRSELVAGEGFGVRAQVAHRKDVPATFSKPDLALPSGWSITKQEEKDGSTNYSVAVPAGAQTPHKPGDFLFPFLPPLVSARTHVDVDGYAFDFTVPVESLHATSVTVLEYPLRIVPPIQLTPQPEQYVVVDSRQPKQFDVFARVHSFAQSPSKVSVGVEVPSGWKASTPVPIAFSGAGDNLVHLTVTPPAKIAAGNYVLKAYAQRGDATYETSLEPLPSLPTYLWESPATIPVHVFSIAVPDHLRVGYVSADNDTAIPDSLRRMGVDVEMLDANALAFGDLSRFDSLVVGMRAYELRPDVVASNARLLEYAAAGGTLVVLDQRPAVWDPLKPAPFPATMGPGPRVTDENAAVNFTDAASPLLNFPNKIGPHDFDGWVQERGLYFLEKWDAQYHAVLSMHDPGEKDLLGSLVWARTGKGTYIYTGLSFSRQLPEGNAGAFRLFVNLLSQSRNSGK
jgi:LmbE family N-acetylglucosaminyl deacetylase